MKKAISLVVACLLFVSLVGCGNLVILNEEEQQAYDCAVKMKSMLKDPDSFKLYDSMYMLQNYDKEGNLLATYTMFKYGGTNSYGAIITNEAVFKDGEYLMDYADEADPEADNYEDQLFFEMAITSYELSKYSDEPYSGYKFLELDVEKIKRKMGLE